MSKLDDLTKQAWNNGNLSYKLWPQQVNIYKQIRAINKVADPVVLCARQFGKSFLGVLMAVEDAIKYQGYSLIIVGPTLKQTVDIVHQGMRIICADMPYPIVKRSKSESRWYVGDSEIIVGGFDTRMASRQRGKTALKIYIEEVVDSDPDQYLESIRSDLSPMLTHSPCPQITYFTTPPRIPDHPFITETIPQAQIESVFYKFTIDDNIILTPEQYASCVKRAGGKDSIEFKREYLCEIVRDTNVVVVPAFDRTKHVKDQGFELQGFFQTAIDWGGVRDKTVAILHTYNYFEDQDLIVDERVFPANTTTIDIVAEVLKMEESFHVKHRYVDAAGQLIVDLHAQGFQCNMPQKDDWKASINKLNGMFAEGKVLVNPRCKFLIQSLESGTFNKNKTDFERSGALGHCDAIAALGYGIRMMQRTSPYGESVKRNYHQGSFMYPKPSQNESLNKAFVPRKFG